MLTQSAQVGAKNFSNGALRQADREFYFVRNLVRRDLGTEAFADGIGEIDSRRIALGQDHNRADLIAYIVIRYGNDGDFGDRGMLLQGIFYFGRGDKNTTAFKAVVAPAGDEEISFAILIGEVSGKVPTVANCRFGSLTILVVAEEQSRIRS